ncbi:hypothetical protein [Bradyrhizobium sp. JYMT SZCCT0428]|uniref:hypothetical protein n=1 Tax=Bradyrhizobium sp. JYMT SZCCT0428 TaxID=2807673 RepID=UPI001BA869A8|nr:hypothetical protein [Bradyrhizobium sp. JYMT SZCCT0428]MBR1150685.1 hypothetical protein [Bradyrhizobium sp. JYMT SZCCT0428]
MQEEGAIDADPESGRLFAHIVETVERELMQNNCTAVIPTTTSRRAARQEVQEGFLGGRSDQEDERLTSRLLTMRMSARWWIISPRTTETSGG